MSKLTEAVTADLSVETRLARIEAVTEVQNLMGKYVNWHAANMHQECLDLFALNTDGVRAEMMWGVYEGRESLTRLYPGFHVWVDGDLKGRMHLHPLSTPVIEVAADAKTAKGTWICPGLETMSFAADADGGEQGTKAHWAWSKFAVDFIIEDGVWKIWHLHVHGIFLTPYDRPWTEDPSDHGGMNLPDEYQPDRPPTTHWMFAPDRIYPNQPEVPLAYTTFDEATAY